MKNGMMYGVLLFLVLSSCTSLILRPKVRSMSGELLVAELKNGSREVQFLNMVHIARPGFYDSVANEVKRAKENGAVLFYEFIDYETDDTLVLRKAQRITGFVPSPENYLQMTGKLLKDGVLEVQDNDKFLHLVNDEDFIVDYTPQRLVKEYEESFGELVLTEEELRLPLDARNPDPEPSEQADVIVLEHRNRHLAEEVNNSEFDRIVVLYGEAHFPGFLDELQKLDKNWIKVAERRIEIRD